MIKRIPVADLIPGMFVHDLACDWLTHPFLRNRFKLTSAAQIARIVEAGIEDVFIDVSRGLDVQGAAGERGARSRKRLPLPRVPATTSPCSPRSARRPGRRSTRRRRASSRCGGAHSTR